MLIDTKTTKILDNRNAITKAYRIDETLCVRNLLSDISNLPTANITAIAKQLVIEARAYKQTQGKIDALLHQYDLSTDEGIALMCLAEALLRIPDTATMDKFISDKLSTVEWKNHVSADNSFFINATTWSLLLTGKIFAPTLDNQKTILSSLKRTTSRLGAAIIRPIILQMMKTIGKQFVLGQDIQSALKRAAKLEPTGYRFSYDMLGEAARTHADAMHYYNSYVDAINAIGQAAHSAHPEENPGISIKLSALHPRYEFTQYHRIMRELPPVLLALAQLAKQYNIGLTVDAEEADRLDMSLDIFELVYKDPSLAGWEGFGLAVQAYQKRAMYVIDWLAALAQEHKKRLMIRLVKGAYWDAEVKVSQVLGLNDYPVFTRKNSTDVSFLACAKKLLSMPNYFYAQFGTHNAYSVAAILEIAGNNQAFEFQCLQGMGRPLYDQIVDKNKFNRPCRIYAPVGTHKDLLGYLVRRLLENGANSSFVNKLADVKTPIEKIITDPIARIASLEKIPHPGIPTPQDIYKYWINSQGVDLSNRTVQLSFKAELEAQDKKKYSAGPLINGKLRSTNKAKAVYSPADPTHLVGYVQSAGEAEVEEALQLTSANKTWEQLSVDARAIILEKAAELFTAEMPALVTLLTREAGKCIPDCISEVRETIDYCRYYAYRARHDLKSIELPGPTGESNQLSLHPRGVIACISPWNFPLAIFSGQILAALVAGNRVIAKPAEQTPLIAYKAIQIMLAAGVPKDVLQLIIGSGKIVGAKIVKDPRVAGVMFTGSTETAKFIEQSLANRPGPIAMFVAETGGQNAMIVDSSALTEQAVIDIATSAFNSAGQRCSALRVLFVQEEMAPKLLEMLKGYLEELTLGDPSVLSTDIGPVIDEGARAMLQRHYEKMQREGILIAAVKAASIPGSFFAPCAFEIKNLKMLEGEVFGPILHVIRYPSQKLDQVLQDIIDTGFGLTLGIQSRIESTVSYITRQMPVGNMYVNRNMIGAVVGVQPFGGEHLSGTGPKAGGPYYLPRLCLERTISNNLTAVGGNARLVSLIEDD